MLERVSIAVYKFFRDAKIFYFMWKCAFESARKYKEMKSSYLNSIGNDSTPVYYSLCGCAFRSRRVFDRGE